MDNTFSAPVGGVGYGLHRSMLDALMDVSPDLINFFEIAPENWINVGGYFGKQLRSYTERFPFICHGLSLSLGGSAPLNLDLLSSIKKFLNEHRIRYYSEHLSYSGDQGHLYELLPIPFTEEAVHHVAARIRHTQDFLGQRIAVENNSYYYAPENEMTECEFINSVLVEADCALLLDVNNLFVNSKNHDYDPFAFLQNLRGDRTAYMHIAGHDTKSESFLVDTHGEAVATEVWDLFNAAQRRFGKLPTALEREKNIPSVDVLLQEINYIRVLQGK